MLKAVIFDVDGVLVDTFKANAIFFQNLMKAAGYEDVGPTLEQYKSMFHMHMKGAIKHLAGDISESELTKIWLMGKKRDGLYPHELVEAPEGIEKVVESIRKKYKIGIVTNRVSEGVRDLPPLVPLLPHFNAIVTYEDTKKHKPHPEPLLLASERMIIEPQQAVYIGDADTDFEAAKAANMKIIMYSDKEYPDADAQVADFDEILSVVESLTELGGQ